MNWFQGGISEAVKQSKQRNAIFVVYIEGADQDDMTQKLTDFVNNGRIRSKLETENFIAIKIGSDSEAYMQFAKIYQVVPVPSIFFIGKSGTPIEIGTSVLTSVEELEQKIDKVLRVAGKSSAAQSSASLISEERNAQLQTAWKSEISDVNNASDPTTSNVASTSAAAATTANIIPTAVATDDSITAAAETKSTEEEIVCDGDVCYKKPKETTTTTTTITTEATTTEINASDATQTETTNINATNEQSIVANDVQQQQQQKEKEQQQQQKEHEQQQQQKEQEQQQQQKEQQQQQRSLEETRKILENRRRERVEMEQKLENERELQRRREGRDAQNLQQWQKEQELKEFKDNIRRERLEEQAARERIRAQIAADRAERATRFANETASLQSSNNNNNKETIEVEGSVKKSSSPQTTTTTSPDSTRLQFRLSNGESRTNTFSCQDTLNIVRNYVRTEILTNTGIKDFVLVTTYPKREFTIEDDKETLMQLDLYPSAVILVISKEKGPSAIIQRSGGIFNMFNTIIWALLSPIVAMFDYLKNLAIGRGNNTIGGNTTTAAAQIGAQKRARDDIQQNAPKRRNLDVFMNGPSTSAAAAAATDTGGATTSKDDDSSSPTNAGGGSTKPYRRYGSSNIHRLTDKRKDSDDENATWNGNSTQQQ